MLSGTMTQVAKQSLVYSYMLSQPFSVYVDAYPVFANHILLEAEQIQYNEHGETVRVLQEKMNKLQYYDDDIDGEFGVLTEHALKKIQTELDITITGEADYQTLKGIIEMEKQEYLDQLDSMSESVYPGMKSEDVKIVQQSLQYFGYYTGEIDGLYGPLTKKAVEIAENNHDIELTPEVSKKSMQSLYETETTEEADQETTEAETSDSDQEETVETSQDKSNEVEADTESEAENETAAENNSTDEKQQPKTKQTVKSDSAFEQIAETAQSFIGVPYAWGGTSPEGFDCSGFIQYVFKTHDMEVPRTVNEMWNFSKTVNKRSIGDLVFFETYKPGPSHMGVYIGDDRFVHAGESNGVTIDNLNDSYWQKRFIGTRRAH